MILLPKQEAKSRGQSRQETIFADDSLGIKIADSL